MDTRPKPPSPQIQRKNSTRMKLKRFRKLLGASYYARAVDMMVLMVLSTIASKQTTGTEQMLEKALQVLDYLAAHPDAKVKFRALDMVMNIHSDASYLTEPKACSKACGHFFMGWLPKDNKPIKLNGAFHTLCLILQFVVVSAAKAELGTLFMNCQEGMIF
jgi:hypothetical protein